MRDVLHNPIDKTDKLPYGAVFCGGRLTLSFRILRRYDIREAYIVLKKDGEDDVYYPMRWCALDRCYDRFSAQVDITSKGLYLYRFEVRSPCGIFSIGADFMQLAEWQSHTMWAFNVYEYYYSSPEWLKKGIYYQILPDRFKIGGKAKKTKDYAVYHDNWDEMPHYLPDKHGEILNNDFFGGNLEGIIEKLDYLKSLNVSCIYLNPIFDAYSNHKYDTGDYENIDSDFGDEQDLKKLVKEAEQRGIRIVLDGVFNHTGSDSRYFNKCGRYNECGAYQSPHSRYFNWFRFRHFPDKYDSWWGISTLPAINEDNADYDNYINGEGGVVQKWMKAGIAGFRLDVVDELPDGFLDNLVRAVKSEKSDSAVIGEVWENAATKTAYGVRRRYFQGKQLDSVTNYPFRRGVLAFASQGDANALVAAVNSVVSAYPKRVTDVLMNILGTHDTERVLTRLILGSGYNLTRGEKARIAIPPERLAEAVARLKVASVVMYGLPGVPCLYYGDEAGIEGFGDPFCRKTYPWGKENQELLAHFKTLGAMRALPVFYEGEIEFIHAGHNLLVFKRTLHDKTAYIAANTGHDAVSIEIEGELVDLFTNKNCKDNLLLAPMSARVLI